MISHGPTSRAGIPHERAESPRDGQTISELLRSLRDNLTILFRQEVALARGEIVENARLTSQHLVTMAVGGGTALAGAIVLLMGCASGAAVALTAAGLDPDTAVWLGPVLLGVVVVVIGLSILQAARQRLKRTSLVPKRTVQTIKEDSTWAKEKLQRS
jgi:hypothetical protein